MEDTAAFDAQFDQAAWNLSQTIINQIGVLLQKSSDNFRAGRLQSSFYDTKEIRLLIHADLKPDERKLLDDLESDVAKYLKQWKLCMLNEEEKVGLSIRNTSQSNLLDIRRLHGDAIKKYRENIMEKMSKYGYLVAKKKEVSVMF